MIDDRVGTCHLELISVSNENLTDTGENVQKWT